MSFWLHHNSALQTATDDLDHVEPNQFAFNPVTLADRYDEVGCVGTFTPTDAAENWFAEEMNNNNLENYFKLDLRNSSNCHFFAEHDGFGKSWKTKVLDEYEEHTPPWIIFHDLLNMRSKHAQSNPVHYTFAVEGNRRRLTLSCVCLGAVATHSQGKLCVGSMIESKMFHLDTSENKQHQLKTLLQSLLEGEEEMTTDDNLSDHCLAVSVRYVVESTVSNEDVLKHL